MLLPVLLAILEGWGPVFSQSRSHRRAMVQALGILTSFGRRTLSRALCALGRQQQDWSADYRLHARAEWKPSRLFQPVLENALPLCGGRYVIAAVDDTRLHKTGRHIQSAFYQRDPLSPKFRFNLMFGLRFLQISLLVPLYADRRLHLARCRCALRRRPLSNTHAAKRRRRNGRCTGRRRNRIIFRLTPCGSSAIFEVRWMKQGNLERLC